MNRHYPMHMKMLLDGQTLFLDAWCQKLCNQILLNIPQSVSGELILCLALQRLDLVHL